MLRLLRVLVLTALAVALTHPALAASESESEKEDSASEAGPPIYLPLQPAFVVNLLNPQGRRPQFMQVKVQVMTRESQVASALAANAPPIRDAMIMLLAHQDSATMSSVQGRETVRLQAQSTIQQVLTEIAGLQGGVEAVYFTDFVIQ